MRISHRAEIVRRWFGIESEPKCASKLHPQIPPLPSPGQIMLILGPSGSGKSSLLRRCRRKLLPPQRIELPELNLPTTRAVVDCFPDLSIEESLLALSRVGLGEAHSYLLSPRQLSDGQRWRLRLALAMEQAHAAPDACLLCDEFAAMLDRVTARVVARVLRRGVDAGSLRAIVATSHEDLAPALNPEIIVRCDFGGLIEIVKSRQ